MSAKSNSTPAGALPADQRKEQYDDGYKIGKSRDEDQ